MNVEETVSAKAKEMDDKRRRERSPAYPRYGLEECVEFITKVDELGGRSVSLASLVASLGVASRTTSSLSGRLSSSKQFGMLEEAGGAVSLTEKGRLLLYPTGGETQKAQLLAEAFSSPPLYQRLLARFDSKKLPDEKRLANILMHDFKLSQAAKDDAVKVFIASARFAGVLSDDNVLRSSAPGGERRDEAADVAGAVRPAEALVVYSTVEVALTSGKTATIKVPVDANRGDIERLKKMLELLLPERSEEPA